jgi:hypothetical protein
MSKNNLNNHVTQNLKESIYKILEEGPTSERNLAQFRERQAASRAERQARGREINAARAERKAQIAAEMSKNVLGDRQDALNTLNQNVEFQRLSATASRGQGQQNTIGGENQRTETSGGVSRMARGVDGRPVSSYINPNSAEGRIEASIAARNEPDLPRDPRTGRLYSGNRTPMQNQDDANYAGKQAFDKSIGFNTTGMTQNQIRDAVRERVRQNTAQVTGEVKAEIQAEIDAENKPKPVTQQASKGIPDLLKRPEEPKPSTGIPELLQRDETMPKFEPKNSGQVTVPVVPKPSTGTPPPHGGRPTAGPPRVNIPRI